MIKITISGSGKGFKQATAKNIVELLHSRCHPVAYAADFAPIPGVAVDGEYDYYVEVINV